MKRYGCAAWGLRETPLTEQLRLVRELGLEYLELSIANHERDPLQLDSSEADARAVAALYKESGVEISCACTGNDFTGEAAELTSQVEKVRRAIDLAAAAGVRFLRIFAGFSSDAVMYGARLERTIEGLRAVARHASGCGVTLVMEMHGGVATCGDALHHFHSCSTRGDLLAVLLREVPELGLLYDPANLAALGEPAAQAFFSQFRDRIKVVHLKDFRDVPGGIVPAACGEGRLDWPVLMAGLAEFDGPCLIEYELTGDVADGMARSLRFLEQF